MRPIGVFGGTFDPIHYGHLRSAFEMLQALDFEEVRFIPCGDPPHRGVTYANARQRYRLVECAIDKQDGFAADDRELRRSFLENVPAHREIAGLFSEINVLKTQSR